MTSLSLLKLWNCKLQLRLSLSCQSVKFPSVSLENTLAMATHDPEKSFASPAPEIASQDLEKFAHLPASQSPHLPGIEDITPSPVSSAHFDDNYELYKNAKDIEADEAELKRVLRKIDFRIIPILFVTYMLQYLDKNSINFSSVYGLQKGTHLVGQDYSWLGMCSSFLYLARRDVGKKQIGSQGSLGEFLSLHNLRNFGSFLLTVPPRFNILLRLPHLSIPLRLPSPTPPNWQIPFPRDHSLGCHPHLHPCVCLLRWHSHQPIPPRRH